MYSRISSLYFPFTYFPYPYLEAQSQHFQLFEYFRLFQTSSENTLKHDTTEFNKIQPVSHMAYSIRHNSARSYL